MKINRWSALAVLAVLGLLAFGNGLSAPLVFDDTGSIVNNPTITEISGATFNPPAGTSVAGRPLVNLSFALNFAAGNGQQSVASYRAVNLALHILTAFVLFLLIERTIDSTSIAVFSAAIWTVHPINNEVVNYVTQRTEGMMALAMMLTLLWASPAPAPPPDRSKKPRPRSLEPSRPTLAIVACFLGMACKETMVLTPLLVVLYDRVFFFSSLKDAFALRGKLYAGLASAWILLAVLIFANGQTISAGFATAHTTPLTYFLNQPRMILHYLQLMAWPGPLVLYYGWPLPLTFADVWPSMAIVTAMFAGSVVLLAVKPRLGFLCAWFFLLLGPTSSFLPIATEVAAERRMYLPSMAIIILVVAGISALLKRTDAADAQPSSALPVAGVVIVGVIAAACITRSIYRNVEYQKPIVLAKTILDRWPTPNAHQLYGNALAFEGRHEEAIAELREGAKGYAVSRYYLGTELMKVGKTDEAIAEFTQFIRDEPNVEGANVAHGMLADAYVERKDYASAIPHYQAFVKANPANGSAWNGLGVAFATLNRVTEAVSAFQAAVNAEPQNPQYQQNLARAIQIARGGGN